MTEEVPRVLPKPLGVAALNLPHLNVKDSQLLITPEKSNLATKESSKNRNDENTTPKLPPGLLTAEGEPKLVSHVESPSVVPEYVDLIPTKLTSLASDPVLDVTPEKLKTALKNHDALTNFKHQGRVKSSRVRFNVPMKDAIIEDTLELEKNPAKELSILKHQNEPFRKKAALYAQRNPLADIPNHCDDQASENGATKFESSTSTNTESSFFTSMSSDPNVPACTTETGLKVSDVRMTLPKVKLKTSDRQPVARLLTTKKKPVNAKDRITVVKCEENQSKLIDQATRPKNIEVNEKSDETKQQFLKKNSSLHRHEHTVRYAVDHKVENALSTVAYNSTLALGQKLQELKTDEFDAKGAVKKRMEESERFRTYVAEKTAEATNIDPEEILYQNLVSITVPSDQLLHGQTTKWKRLAHKPLKPKTPVGPEPNIWDFYYPDDLFEAEPEYGATEWIVKPRNDIGLQIKPCLASPEPSPINAAENLDSHEQLWSGAWGRHLPQEWNRIDVLL